MDLRNKKSLWIWIENSSVSDDDDDAMHTTPVLRLEDGTVEKYAIGESFGILVSEDEKFYQIGQHGEEILSLPSIESSLCEVSLLKSVVIAEVSCGHQHSAALTESGIVYCWGLSKDGQCGAVADMVSDPIPITAHVLGEPVHFRSISCGKSHTMAISDNSELWGWGLSQMVGGKVGLTRNTPSPKPELVNRLTGRRVLQVCCGAHHTVALTEEVIGKSQSGSSAVCSVCKKETFRMFDSADHVIITDAHICSAQESNGGTHGKRFQTHNRSSSLPFFTKSNSLAARRQNGNGTIQPPTSLAIPITKSASSRSLEMRSNIEKVELTPIASHATNANPGKRLSPSKSLDIHFDTGRQNGVSQKQVPGTDRPRNGDLFSLSDSTGSCSSLVSMDNCKSRMTLPVSSVSGLEIEDTESALAFLKQLSPDENSLDSMPIVTAKEPPKSGENLPKIDEGTDSAKKTLSERITDSLTDSQLLSPLTSYSKNVVSGVMDRIEWIKSSAIEGVTPIKDFLLKERAEDRNGIEDASLLGDPLRYSSPASHQSPDKSDAVPLTLRTEVWTWGNNDDGQLGMADALDRFQPTCVKSLTHRGVVKVACGSHHSMALTSNSEVFSWGRNLRGQLGREDSNNRHPVKIDCRDCVWDIAAGRSHSLFLTDGISEEPSVLACGSGPGDTSLSHPLKGGVGGGAREHWKLRPIHFSSKMGFQCHVAAGPSNVSTCLSEEAPSDVRLSLRALAKSERSFYRQITLIKTDFLRPLKFSDLYKTLEGTKYAGVLASLLEFFGRLSYHIGLNTVQMNRFVVRGKHCDESTFSYMTHNLLQSFEKYFKCLNDLIAFGFFEQCEELSAKQAKFLSKDNIALLFKNLLGERRASASVSESFLQLLQLPAFRLREYASILKNFASLTEENIPLSTFLEGLAGKWNTLWTGINNQLQSANDTRRLWKDEFKSNKMKQIADNLKKRGRYLILHSKQVPLDNLNSSRFSSNWFLLFNDALVLINNGSIFPYDLQTTWCSLVADGTEVNCEIKVVTPEEEFSVSARQNDFKTQWITTINRAINSALRGDEQISPSHESKQYHRPPPAVRHASYAYVKLADLKGATYDGSWLNGKRNGKGEMSWEDGKSYRGNFKDGKEHGYGEWNAGANDQTMLRYHGWWRNGKMDGQGKLWYSKTQVYEGSFKSGLRDGHGVLRTGSVTEGSVYVGSWKNDQRNGFGVEDNISKGEKYIGMWTKNERNGSGILVTLDGLYSLGTFSHGHLSGDAILIQGQYVLEGVVSQGLTLAGKGRLTMPNGDRLDGVFSGAWGSSIRISGHIHRTEIAHPVPRTPESPRTSVDSGFGFGPHKDRAKTVLRRYNRQIMKKLVANKGAKSFPINLHPDMKWIDVFAKCRAALNCPEEESNAGMPETKNIWDALSVSMATARRMHEDRTRSTNSSPRKGEETRLNWLERVPAVVTEDRDTPSAKDIEDIKEYVVQAFDSAIHPLGELAESLSSVFRDSYSGAGAHKWLLSQAVGDVRSFTRRSYDILRCLFPMLDKEENASHMKIVNEEDEGESYGDPQVTAGDLLLPVLLPRVYPSLFTLYALRHEREDQSYWERVTRLNRHPDIALLSFLGVKPKFWLLDESAVPPLECPPDNGQLYDTVDHAESSRWKHLLIAAAKDCSFLSAIESLQLISTTFIPAEKLNIIQSTFKKINETVLHYHKKSHSWCMDDLFPVFQYVVVRARISHLGCEIQLIEDFLEPDICKGEKGIMFATLKACYFQIRVEKNL